MGQTLTNVDLEVIDAFIVYGVGDGSVYRSLASWLKKNDNRFLIFVEEDEERFLSAKELPLAKDPKVRLFFYKKGDVEIFQQIAWEFVFLRFGYSSEEGEEFFAQLEHYHRGVDLLASDCEDMGVKVLTNAIRNLARLPQSHLGQALEGKCAGIPAIVVGAGPSLNQAVHELAKLKDHAIIIAGGSAARALNAQGIEPHVFAHVDPKPPYHRFLEQECFETPFFYQGRFCSDLLPLVQGPLMWMADGGNYPLETWMAAESGVFAERFDAGWTVANFSTAIAAHLGCSPIILVGMDFSCGADAIYASQMAGVENQEELIEIKKGELYSKRDWMMSAEWTSAFARTHDKIEWINASTQGLDLPGIERKPLSEDLFKTQHDISGIVHTLTVDAPLSQATHIDEVREKLKKSFEKCLTLCDAMLKVWEKHYPHSPLEKGEYALLDTELEQEICHRHFLMPLWNVWKRPILRASFHPLGQHIHRLLFFKKAIIGNLHEQVHFNTR